MPTFVKATQVYQQGQRTLPGRYYTSPEIYAEEQERIHTVPLETWEGFTFVNLAREPQAFAQAFAPLAGRFSRFNLSTLKSARRIDYDVAANWKLVFQNYSECLHCPVIHPGLAKLTPYT